MGFLQSILVFSEFNLGANFISVSIFCLLGFKLLLKTPFIVLTRSSAPILDSLEYNDTKSSSLLIINSSFKRISPWSIFSLIKSVVTPVLV